MQQTQIVNFGVRRSTADAGYLRVAAAGGHRGSGRDGRAMRVDGNSQLTDSLNRAECLPRTGAQTPRRCRTPAFTPAWRQSDRQLCHTPALFKTSSHCVDSAISYVTQGTPRWHLHVPVDSVIAYIGGDRSSLAPRLRMSDSDADMRACPGLSIEGYTWVTRGPTVFDDGAAPSKNHQSTLPAKEIMQVLTKRRVADSVSNRRRIRIYGWVSMHATPGQLQRAHTVASCLGPLASLRGATRKSWIRISYRGFIGWRLGSSQPASACGPSTTQADRAGVVL
ncbi:hypothetical protein BDZ97DRAFT_1753959 [Flammula alnicola]|nr:hypothetical protein BDZ97DRAFT_1753959 [Flammula alnicola]